MGKIRISESELQNIIKEAVTKILKEDFDYDKNIAFSLLEQLKIELGASELCDRLLDRLSGCIGYSGVVKTLKEIKDIELPSLEDEEEESDIEVEG